jgi:hypothetical protein
MYLDFCHLGYHWPKKGKGLYLIEGKDAQCDTIIEQSDGYDMEDFTRHFCSDEASEPSAARANLEPNLSLWLPVSNLLPNYDHGCKAWNKAYPKPGMANEEWYKNDPTRGKKHTLK